MILLGSKVLLLEEDNKEVEGLVFTQQLTSQFKTGVVSLVGDKVTNMDLQENKKVMFEKSKAREINIKGSEFLLIDSQDIILIL